MIFSLLSVVIIGVAAAIIYKQTRKGYRHGLSRSLIHLATLLCCAIFSAPISSLLAKALSGLLFKWVSGKGWLGFLGGALDMIGVIVELILAMILAVLLYLPVFFIFKFLFRRALSVFMSMFLTSAKRAKTKTPQYLSEEEPFYVRHEKPIAAFVGALAGLVLVIVLFMPLTGILKTGDDIIDTVAEMTHNETIQQSTAARLLDHYGNDASGTVLRACGGNALYNMTARISYEGHSTHLNKEIATIRSMQILDRLKEIRASGTISAASTDQLYGILEDLERSLFLRIVMVEFVREASESWMQHEPFMGIERPSLGNYQAVDDLFDSILFICSTTTVDSCDTDTRTILALAGILSEYQSVFGSNDYASIMNELCDSDVLERIEEELAKNPRMSSLNAAVDGLIMTVVATELSGLSADAEETHAIYQSIADIMNSARGLDGSVKMTAIANGVSESFAAHGIYLPAAMEDRMASILTSTIPSDEFLTEDRVKAYFDEHVHE